MNCAIFDAGDNPELIQEGLNPYKTSAKLFRERIGCFGFNPLIIKMAGVHYENKISVIPAIRNDIGKVNGGEKNHLN